MPAAAANAVAQTGALKAFISKRTADSKVTLAETKEILAEAKKGGVQVGELGLLRTLAGRKAITDGARSSFRTAVDTIVPDGAPTARLAAILNRVDPKVGRAQLLAELENARSPVAGGPRTYVIRDTGVPYVAAITTGQVVLGLAKFMKGASPEDATRLRTLLGEQLTALEQPVSRGGLRVPGLKGEQGLALAAVSTAGPFLAVNQNAFVLRALEGVVNLKGEANAALVARAKHVAGRVATELEADLGVAYPSKGALAYGFQVVNGRASVHRLEDGDHLGTTLDALRALKTYGKRFEPHVARLEKRLPMLKYASADDLDGRAGRIFTDEFHAVSERVARARKNDFVSVREAKAIVALVDRDGVRTSGEKELLRRAALDASKKAKALLEG